MTFDSAISTDFGTFLADLRDKVGGMTNWNIKDDSTGGAASIAAGGWYVLTTPTGEDIRIYHNTNGYQGMQVEYGPDWDATNDGWNDKYPQSPENHISGNSPNKYIPNSNDHMAETDAVTYWMEYVDGNGFAWYVQREEADGNDADVAGGFSQITELWDYDAAAKRESDYVWFGSGQFVHGGNTFFSRDYYHAGGEGLGSVRSPYGLVNPDANFSNFPWTDGIYNSNQYQNASGTAVIIGSTDPTVLVRDHSGGDSAHRDTVQDANGNNVYTVLKRNKAKVLMRMD